MIPLQLQPAPGDFKSKVKDPGLYFLQALSRKPTHKDYRKANAEYWRRVTPEIYQAYDGVCAYSSHAIPWLNRQGIQGEDPTIDHFIPRHVNPSLAYEWSNYRLAMRKLNEYKGEKEWVMDPFCIKHDWFTLNFATMRVEPNTQLPRYLRNHVTKTIEILRLNKDNNLVGTRQAVIIEYANGGFPLDWLERKYPFIAYELKRQGEESRIKERFSKRSASFSSNG